MQCDVCGTTMRRRRTTARTPYHYTLAGLPHVQLIGVLVRECPAGHGNVPTIPRPGELHRVIARTLIDKSAPLDGAEIRFLRKNAGLSGQKFAALLGVDPTHLSRIENGRTKALGPSTDRLARAIAAAAADTDVRTVLLHEAEARLERKRPAAVFKVERHRWRAA